MSVRFYDEALINKIQGWTLDPNLRILKPEDTTRLLQMKADEENDQPLSLPLIAVSRDKNIEITDVTKQPKTFSGVNIVGKQTEPYDGNKESIKLKSLTFNAVPIKIGYQLDIYTRFFAECDEYVRNFVFNFINDPKMVVNIPYQGLDLKHDCTLTLQNSISDNSDIREHLFPDQFTRFTIKINIEDAYLFSIPNITNTINEKMELNFMNKDHAEATEKEEIIFVSPPKNDAKLNIENKKGEK